MKILLTGAAGFIGLHVAQRLLARGDEVVGGREVADMKFASESEERSVTREFAITWQDELPPGNEVVAGAWWKVTSEERDGRAQAPAGLVPDGGLTLGRGRRLARIPDRRRLV